MLIMTESLFINLKAKMKIKQYLRQSQYLLVLIRVS